MAQQTGAKPRIVFMGAGPFALPALNELSSQYPIVGVVTQPDRDSGRGRKLRRGPVAAMADERSILVLQPHTFKDALAVEQLKELCPEVLVVASYGRILPRSVLDLPVHGALNLHPSLLPKHRGPSPVAGAILSGDSMTGVTVMEMVVRMDAGPIVAQRTIPVHDNDTTQSLTQRLALENVKLLLECLPSWHDNSIGTTPQEESQATYTQLFTKEMGDLDWSKSAHVLEREVRAFNPWPVAHTTLGEPLRIFAATVGEQRLGSPGTIVRIDHDGIAVQTGDSLLILTEVQPAGGRRMLASDFARGHPELSAVRIESE